VWRPGPRWRDQGLPDNPRCSAFYWDSGELNPPWFEVDLGKITTFDEIHLYESYEPFYVRIKVKANVDDPWIDISEVLLDNDGRYPNIIKFNQVNAEYIRVEFADSEFQNEIPSWKGASEIEVYNSLGGLTLYPSFDADSLIQFLQLYNPDKVTVVDDTPAELMNLLFANPPLGAGLSEDQVELITSDDTFDYWRSFSTIVVADPDNYKEALMGSVIASYLNVPFVLINDENLNEYEEMIQNRWVYAIAPLDSAVRDYIENNAEQSFIFPIEVFQQQYLGLTRTDKVMMVNPNDINEVYRSPNGIYPDRSPYKIFDLFSKSSLAAPFLAAGKHELMLFNDVPVSPLNDDCSFSQELIDNSYYTSEFLKNKIQFFFRDYKPEFLTIVASPKAIPDSLLNTCYGGLGQERMQKDYEYAKSPSDFDDLKKPDVAVDSDGNMHVVWLEEGHRIVYSEYDNDGRVLIDDLQVFAGGTWVDNPKIDTDSNNDAHIVWEGISDSGHWEVYYAKVVNGEVLNEKIIPFEDDYTSNQPDLIVDSNDKVHVVYVDWSLSDPKIFYIRLDNDGNLETFPSQISADGDSYARWPKINVDSGGYVHVVYNDRVPPDDIDDQVYYTKYYDYEILVNKRVSENIGDTRKADIALDQNEDVHVVWSETRNRKDYLYYSKLDNDGNTIVGSRELEDIKQLSINPSVLADNKVHIIWKDKENGLPSILYKKLNINGNPSSPVRVITKSGADIIVAAFDRDSYGNFFVAYQAAILDDFVFYKKIDENIREIIPDTMVSEKYDYYMDVGRIYGISTTDVSSYIARALFYDELMDKVYGSDYTGTATARRINSDYPHYMENEALEIRDKTSTSGYDSVCSVESDIGCDHTGRWDIPESFFQHKQFFTFTDHGWINALDGVIYSSTLPEMELTWIDAPSCSPANFWSGLDMEPGVHTLGHIALRKGAIGFHGATGVSYTSTLPSAPYSVRLLTQEEGITIGKMGTYLTGINRYIDEHFITLGDPTIVLRGKYVRWDDSNVPIRKYVEERAK